MPGLGCCIEKSLVHEAQKVVDQLRREKLSVVTAESCTAGLIAATLSHGEGASDCLHGGFVVYTKESKARALGVSQATLGSDGSVSEQTARQMVEGALARSPADIALSVTGVLGPDRDEDGHPPGLVYFAVGRREQAPFVIEEHFRESNPDATRRAVVLRAFELLRENALS